ncbi:thioredoxin-dependent thiol peroxidase [Candidatus Cloacimonadota bacterium]
MLKIGDKAPQFNLPDQNDNNRTLTEFKGKWTVLYFYPKDNTSGCTKEACDFTDELDNFRSLDAVVIGVSPDNTSSHRNFIQKYDLKLIFLSDEDKEVMKQYGAWGLKKNYGKEYEGVIRSTFLISPEGKIAASWSKVKVRVKRKDGEVKHADIVKAKLTELRDQ